MVAYCVAVAAVAAVAAAAASVAVGVADGVACRLQAGADQAGADQHFLLFTGAAAKLAAYQFKVSLSPADACPMCYRHQHGSASGVDIAGSGHG